MIIFPIETVVRELPYKLELAFRLNARLNEIVIIAPKSICYQLLRFVGNDVIYFDKGYHKNESEKIFGLIKKNGGLVVSLDEEGAVDFDDMRTLRSRYTKELVRSVEIVFFWGDLQKKYFENLIHLGSAKLVVSGHPRFFNLREQPTKVFNGEFLLINTNMSFGNNILGDNFVRSNYSSRVKDLEVLIEFDKRKIALIKEFISEFRSKSEIPIVIRPHPEECEDTYILPIDKCVVSKLGVVQEVMENAIWMVHTDCTTAIEAYVQGFEPISLLPVGFDRFKTILPRKVSICFSEPCEVVDHLLYQRKHVLNTNGQELNDWILMDSDPNEIIVGEIEELRTGKPLEGGIYKILKAFFLYILILYLVLKSQLAKLKKSSRFVSEFKLNQFDRVYTKCKKVKEYKRVRKISNVIIFK